MESDGLRMFLVFYVFGFFIITTNYKAALLSYSTIPMVPNPIGIGVLLYNYFKILVQYFV